MQIIDKHSLLSSVEKMMLTVVTNADFQLEGYRSPYEMLRELGIKVYIEPGVVTRQVSGYYDEAEKFWREEANRREACCGEEGLDDYKEALKHVKEIQTEKEHLGLMPIRGCYCHSEKAIKLYPEEWELEYDGQRRAEIMLSTFLHEAMHAYFSRPGHDRFPYVPFVEEPLAEFGMLLYLHEIGNPYYDWAYDDVLSKKTCYHWGAYLMDQYDMQHNNSLRKYLVNYKSDLHTYAMPVVSEKDRTITLPVKGTGIYSARPIVVSGNKIKPVWRDVIDSPTYFFDERTNTLGLDGAWMDCFAHDDLFDMLAECAEHLYLGDNFWLVDDCKFITRITGYADVTLSPANKAYELDNNGIVVCKCDFCIIAPIYPSLSETHIAVLLNGKTWICDSAADFISKRGYDFVWSFEKNGLCRVELGRMFGFVNEHGDEQIPLEYQQIYRFENGVTVAKKGGMYGLIDEHNNIIHPFNLDYQDIRAIKNGFATMEDDRGKWGAIDAKGNVVIPCQYDSLVHFDEQGHAKVMHDGREFVIDTRGNEVE